MIEIANRTAFITGGANGIGLGIARALAREGAKIALADLDEAALRAAKAELGSLTEVFCATLDVRDREAYARIADSVEASVGPVSILVNNAGVAPGAPAEKLTYELWDWGMKINLDGVINGVQTFLPRMMARRDGGYVINTASGAGLSAATGGGVLYCTAKFGVVGLSESLRIELERAGIGVSVLCPGPVATGIIDRTRAGQPKVTKSFSTTQKASAVERSKAFSEALAKGTTPEEVGDMVVKGMRENQLYIHTDRISEQAIVARTRALLEAMPPAA